MIEGLDINWGWTPHRATHVLPQGTIAIKYNLLKDKTDKTKFEFLQPCASWRLEGGISVKKGYAIRGKNVKEIFWHS